MSLFDFVEEDEKKNYQITFPNVGEYTKDELLAFEKEMLGVYVSGHPMEAYEEGWRKNITAVSTDFIVEEETGTAVVRDESFVTIGGMIMGRTLKTTRNNKLMAFVTVEDMYGSVEVLVFPNVFEKKREYFEQDNKVFIRGRASIGDDPVGKVICEQVYSFDDIPRELWIQFPDKEAYIAGEAGLLDELRMFEGKDTVIIYLEKERARKALPRNWNVRAEKELLDRLVSKVGERNVKLVEKTIEKIGKMH